MMINNNYKFIIITFLKLLNNLKYVHDTNSSLKFRFLTVFSCVYDKQTAKKRIHLNTTATLIYPRKGLREAGQGCSLQLK